jgi:hypothetical protein
MLNAAGLKTGKGKPFTAKHVAIVRANHKIRAPRPGRRGVLGEFRLTAVRRRSVTAPPTRRERFDCR